MLALYVASHPSYVAWSEPSFKEPELHTLHKHFLIERLDHTITTVLDAYGQG